MFKVVCAQRLLSIAEFDPQYLLIPELNAAGSLGGSDRN